MNNDVAPWIKAFLNLVFLAVLAFILPDRVAKLLPPCISGEVARISVAIIVLAVLHLIWRVPQIRNIFQKRADNIWRIPARLLAELFDALHPWILPDWALWALAIVLISAAGILGLSPLSPFAIPEPLSIIQNFLVHYPAGHTETFVAGDLVELPADTTVLVEAVVSDQAGVSCTWSAVKGSQIPAKRCATIYNPPFEGDRDALSILAQSPCKTWQAFAGLHIKVVQVQP